MEWPTRVANPSNQPGISRVYQRVPLSLQVKWLLGVCRDRRISQESAEELADGCRQCPARSTSHTFKLDRASLPKALQLLAHVALVQVR